MKETDQEIFSQVLVDVDARNIDRNFCYLIPDRLVDRIGIGSVVIVPFGRRKVTGYIIDLGTDPLVLSKGIRIKNIEEIVDEGPVFTKKQLELARWMSEYYLCSLISALQTVIAPRIHRTGPKKVNGLFVIPNLPEPEFSPRAVKSHLLWQTVKNNPGLTPGRAAELAGVSESVAGRLVSLGILEYRSIEIRRNPYPLIEKISQKEYMHTPEQNAALEEIRRAINTGGSKVFLLFGVTGSGKTEVYIQAIKQCLAKGKQSLLLVPEIALTPQLITEFKGLFGDKVAVLHSRLSDGERYDEWNRIASGLAQVILGTRSAAFAPLNNLGLAIMDEEHEPSYKQEENPRYHAREVVLRLIGQFNGVAVLGSATPSLESYQRTFPGGPYTLLSMLNRVEMREMPTVRLIDMGEELKTGSPGILSNIMISAINQRLEKKEQVVLFLNRRGYATLVVCRECGLVMKCSHCDISLTYHNAGHLSCHYCNGLFPGQFCPDCGSKLVEYFGAGTQKLEEEIKGQFPKAVVVRMDSDTTTRKGSHGKILSIFREGKADILIGTQMVAKGLDIPDVTLVGVVNADLSLHMPDFRSSERTFQLIAQVAGRTGRGELGGEVMVQTFTPKHYSILYASKHDYPGFFNYEINIRKAMRYPPFSRLARILFFGREEEDVKKNAVKWASILKKKIEINRYSELIEILGPAPAQISKIKDRYRYHIVVKSGSGKQLKALINEVIKDNGDKFKKDSGFMVDIDPQSLM
ncbi:MAG: primosomal protein N' [Peptococcaceae bacterium]|nr:primosomal protein N' [Peptococcaceae bacterium]